MLDISRLDVFQEQLLSIEMLLTYPPKTGCNTRFYRLSILKQRSTNETNLPTFSHKKKTYLVRMRTRAGAAVIRARRAKGRAKLSV